MARQLLSVRRKNTRALADAEIDTNQRLHVQAIIAAGYLLNTLEGSALSRELAARLSSAANEVRLGETARLRSAGECRRQLHG
jgi:hypothetical protein